MQKYIFVSLVLFALVVSSVALGQGGGRSIVVFDVALNDAAQDALVAHAGGAVLKNLDLINAKAVWLPSRAAERALGSVTGVLRVEEDALVTTMAQTLPWGVDTLDAELVWPTGNTADLVKVAVVDTGISTSHPDLKANVKGGVNTINPAKGWNDDNGHGSHVAGTIGAVNNTVGVVGVAPAADLYAVKVLGANGSGYVSDIIEGLQWSVANGMQVVNMSLGTSVDVVSLHDAVTAAYNAGVVLVAAAGNSGGAVIYPAAYSEVLAVSATDSNNLLASFSSFGPEVDLAAPGVSVLSTYKGKFYATLSGTSMATPHVTGAAALVLNTPVGVWDADFDGVWDPSEVQNKLQSTATDLGAAGYDTLYGYGLVNAFAAVQ